jgi:integrase
MAWSRKSKKKAGRVVRRTLADGTTRAYHYAAYKPRAPKHAADSVQALVDAYRRSDAWTNLAPATQAVYGIYLREFEDAGKAIVENVTRRHLLDAQDAIARTRGNGAATGYMRTAGALFGWAVDRGWIDRSPVHRIPKRLGGSLPAWAPEQAAIALSGLPEHLRRVVVLGAYTGQRRGDLCALTWAAYDGETIRLTQEKGRRRKPVEIAIAVHPELQRELDAWKAEARTLTILANQFGRPWSVHTLSGALPRELQRLGLPKGLNVHGMRKLFAATLAEQGASTQQIMAGTGHRTIGMAELYTRSADQKRLNASAISLLPKIVPITTTYKRGKS